jgi:hypothetical protein
MKLFRSFVLFLLFCPLIKTIAQDTLSVEKNQFKIDFLNPGFTYEHGLTTNSTLFSEVGLALAYSYSDYFGSSFIMTPFISEEYRYYYNFERRIKKGKNILRNSGNYLGLNASYYFIPLGHENENYVGGSQLAAFYGLQRTSKRGFNIGYQVGVGYEISKSDDDDGFTPYFRFTMGWVLGKKK